MTIVRTPLALGPLALPSSSSGGTPPVSAIVIDATGSIVSVNLSSLTPGVYRLHFGPTGTSADPVCALVNSPHATLLTVTSAGAGTVQICTPSITPGSSLQVYAENIRSGGQLLSQVYTALPRQVVSRTNGLRRLLLPQKLAVGKLRF